MAFICERRVGGDRLAQASASVRTVSSGTTLFNEPDASARAAGVFAEEPISHAFRPAYERVQVTRAGRSP